MSLVHQRQAEFLVTNNREHSSLLKQKGFLVAYKSPGGLENQTWILPSQVQ